MSNLENCRAQRLDQKVVELLPELSRAFAAKLIEQGKVTVSGRVVVKPGEKLHQHDTVSVDYDPSELEQIPNIELPILYEDDDCIVINKPVGILTHSKGAFNPEATVATFLRGHLLKSQNPHLLEDGPLDNERAGIVAEKKKYEKRNKGHSDPTKPLISSSLFLTSSDRVGIVHRLDRATSGVMICAKTPAALSWLQKQFSRRKVKKTYVAIIHGEVEPAHAVIDMPIERNPKAPATFRTGVNGKPAVTEYVVEKTGQKYSLLKLAPQTGRTHQLRVHLKQVGHPIVGDVLYGGEPADRMYLHAESLEITLPNRKRKIFTAKLPDGFTRKVGQE